VVFVLNAVEVNQRQALFHASGDLLLAQIGLVFAQTERDIFEDRQRIEQRWLLKTMPHLRRTGNI